MKKVYLCWSGAGKVKGVASSKKQAEKICGEIGDCYTPVQLNTSPAEDLEVTRISVHNTKAGFLTYSEAVELVKTVAHTA